MEERKTGVNSLLCSFSLRGAERAKAGSRSSRQQKEFLSYTGGKRFRDCLGLLFDWMTGLKSKAELFSCVSLLFFSAKEYDLWT